MSTSPFVDSRTDKTGVTRTYKTVQLKDGNVWLAENFDYFINDDVCQSINGGKMDSESIRKSYGTALYYAWTAFAPNLGLIPAGWHLPTIDEWKAMVNCYGGMDSAYEHLVEGGSSGLNLGIDGGTFIPNQDCKQLAMEGMAYFWSASEGDDKGYAAIVELDENKKLAKIQYVHKYFRFNIRLVKNK